MNNPIRALIIDDHEMVLDALKQFVNLQQSSAIEITHTANTEREARRILQDQDFDVVVVDMRLPRDRNEPKDNESGLRIIKIIKQQFPKTRVLAISGELDKSEFILRVIRSGADGYVLKRAAGLKEVIDAIERVFRGDKVYPQEVVRFVVDTGLDTNQPSNREQEVWQLIADGLTNREIAQRLNMTLDTVKRCTSDLYSKIGVTNRAQATRKWLEEQYGLVELS